MTIDDIQDGETPEELTSEEGGIEETSEVREDDDLDDELAAEPGNIDLDELDEPEAPAPVIKLDLSNLNAIQQFFYGPVADRAQRSERLRTHLPSPVKVRIFDKNLSFCLDWTQPELRISENTTEQVACTVSLRERDFQSLVEGRLNPQVAMLSDKIKVEGQTSLAIYIFNLLIDNRYH